MMKESGALPALEMRGITKHFPGVVANDNVSFDLLKGEVHSLLGENGAGKSTLMKVLYGFYPPDSGQVRLNGHLVNLTSPAHAIANGICMIHQHFMLVPTLTVAENVSLGLRSSRHPLTDLAAVAQRIQQLSDTFGLQVDPFAYVWQLAVGERQRVEIIKALYRDASILILDEPTAVLTPKEVDDLFHILKQMAQAGRSLIFISHKLHEVLTLSDRITVLRNGRVTGEANPCDTSREKLAQMMVGREVKLAPDKPNTQICKPRLEVEDLVVEGDRKTDAVCGLSFQICGGEVLGVAGVSGNGQRELAEAICGLRKPKAGLIKIDGQSVPPGNAKAAREAGLSYVPEERMRDGAIADFNIFENFILLNHGQKRFCRMGFLRFAHIHQHSRALIDEYTVKTPNLETPAKNLSGGNIQKLILARELSSDPKVLIAAQPTRGVDIGAAEYIHERLSHQRTNGTATLVISEDLDEVLALSDRIAVMFEGRIMGIVNREEASREHIGLMMAGVDPDSPPADYCPAPDN